MRVSERVFNEINKERKNNKNQWYYMKTLIVEKSREYDIAVKGIGTWLQILSINGINHSNNMDRSVKGFKADIINAVEYHS